MEPPASDVHQSLGYLVALAAQNYAPTITELEAYAEQPGRRPPRYESTMTRAFTSAFTNLWWASQEQVAPGESMAEHFLRLHWASEDAGRLYVTELGRAIYRAFEQQTLEPDTVVDIVIEATDSTAFAQVVGRIGASGPALLVEPYFRLDVLMPIVQYTVVTRVLASERTKPNERNSLKLGIESLTLDRPFEVRVASKDVHDRYLLPDAGPVQFIGASLNGLGHVATAMGKVNDGSDAIRQLYEAIWNSSPVLAVAQQSAPSTAIAKKAAVPSAKKAPQTRKKA